MTETLTINGAVPIVPYADPRAGIRWLEQTFGAVATAVHPPEPDQPLVHAEVKVGTGLVMINDAERDNGSPFAMPGPVLLYVVVEDPDALHDRAVAAGAEIVMGLTDKDYGSREFAARDPHGNGGASGPTGRAWAESGDTHVEVGQVGLARAVRDAAAAATGTVRAARPCRGTRCCIPVTRIVCGISAFMRSL